MGCIGTSFAQYEMKLIIAEIMLHLNLELVDNYTASFKRSGPIFAPSHGMPIRVNRK